MRTAICVLAALPLLAAAQPAASHLEGRLPSGAAYVIDVPADWNGRLLLFSHGYARGPANPARNVSRNEKDDLLKQGYALAGSSYASVGWALEEAVPDQLATLDAFATQVGKPQRTYAWGSSMGGLVTIALLERAPQRFDGGIVMCASAGGAPAMMNAALDGPWVLRTLAGLPPELPVLLASGGDGMRADLAAWQAALDREQSTPAGRARIALAATLAQVPLWREGTGAPPQDAAAQQEALYRGFVAATLLPRDDQQRRAGGNFSWNTGIDYAQLLDRSGRADFVRAQYRAAGVDLETDLARLAAAPRVGADPAARAYMQRNYAPTGRVQAPVLVMQTVADPVTLVEMSGDYAARIARRSGASLVREAYIGRVGHCNFTTEETVAAVRALERRREQGNWDTTIPGTVDFRPAPFLRSEQ
ncbi:serine aminopeptidase domain-containing protein [Pseudoduganella sp. UC29_106]|uniref:serine aminopeptidase domain-containing protein n=1 Tax=Pseudoduganella sp. UC29_106 TaxID=3374553 RepID=UPI003757CF20